MDIEGGKVKGEMGWKSGELGSGLENEIAFGKRNSFAENACVVPGQEAGNLAGKADERVWLGNIEADQEAHPEGGDIHDGEIGDNGEGIGLLKMPLEKE